MIIHRHSDGSEGYEYALGDTVVITGVVPFSEWFKRAIGRTGPIVEIERGPWQIAFLYVKDLDDYGPTHCAHWQVKPTAETITAARIVSAETGEPIERLLSEIEAAGWAVREKGKESGT